MRDPSCATGSAQFAVERVEPICDRADLRRAGRDDHQRPRNREVLDEQRSLGLVGEIEMKHKGGSDTKQGERACGERKPPAHQEGRARAQFQQNDQRKQYAWNMVRGHMIQERLRAGDLRHTSENEQQRKKAPADNRNDSDGHGVLLCPLPNMLQDIT